MNRMLILVVVAMMTMMTVNAQSLAGRTYYNANILAGEMNKKLKEVDQKLPEIRAEKYAKFEKEKGHKPTAAEKAKLDKATYVVKGDLIILNDGEEKDTLRLSSDGKYLSGKFEKDINFKLTRTK